jgi:hypothetical protein
MNPAEPFGAFAKENASIPEEQFLDRFKDPFLISDGPLPSKKPSAKGEPMVIRLSRGARKMVTVGRAPDCDISIDAEKISKHHAYFDQEADGSWFVADAGSTNGTFVDGKQVEAHEHQALSDSTTIRFSPDIGFRFFGPAAFFRYVSMRTRKNP